ncbi:GPO family capsid scaffolding protein [Desulfoluna butyratoxydans]|uniref:Capsid scaffolding protein gpo n=1 Tax=Desulfoluna butyratoxydans TaxID=231438 RepID=A0A4U8YGP3_9BACT|nr:GPO family capsid scaffolding protein [Desulfoluna butyratoxydans]VFQ42400.1 capsid scaffolding protein gpo [Desulfoluna butyratoxydans]
MPSSLVTDWKCVATSGPTVDGRVLQPQWFTDMAETYSPATYTAKIWIDHMRGGSYGSVRELKTEEVDGVLKLYAKISPNRSLLQMNQVWEEYLHFSIEVTEDFAGTGKTYLTGLAMTDSPASLGTDEMRFNKMKGREFTARYAGEEVPDLSKEFMGDEDRFMTTFFRKLAHFFTDENHDEETGDDPMNTEQFEAVKDTLEATQQAVEGLAGHMQTFMETFKTTPAGDEKGAGGEGEGGGSEGSETPAPAGEAQYTELKTSVDTMVKAFNTMTERMEQRAPGTRFRENPNPAGEHDELL